MVAGCREQRLAVKFCFLLGKSAAETIVMLKTAYGDLPSVKLESSSGFHVLKMGKCQLKTNPVQDAPQRQAVTKMSTKSMPSFVKSSIQRILSEDLHMGRVVTKFVPRLLTGEQRKRRLQACFELQNQLKGHDSNCPPPLLTGPGPL